MSSKQGIHNWSLMMKNKYGCQMHSSMRITGEPKAHWFSCFW